MCTAAETLTEQGVFVFPPENDLILTYILISEGMEGDRMEVGDLKQNPNETNNIHVEVHVKSTRF